MTLISSTSTPTSTPTSSTDSLTVSDITELHAVDNTSELEIKRLTTEAIQMLQISQYKVEVTHTKEDKQRAMFQVGAALQKIREKYPSNEEYSAYVDSDIIKKCPNMGVTKRTLQRYKSLANFNTTIDTEKQAELCLKIGFTLVYKLTEEDNSDIKQWAIDNSELSQSDLRLGINKLLFPEKFTEKKQQHYLQLKADISDVELLTKEQAEELVKLLTETHGIES